MLWQNYPHEKKEDKDETKEKKEGGRGRKGAEVSVGGMMCEKVEGLATVFKIISAERGKKR